MSSQDRHTTSTLESSNPPQDTLVRDQSPQAGSSDGEGGERTAREKLKKTSIAGLAQQSQPKASLVAASPLSETTTSEPSAKPTTENGLRGRPSKKRSFEDLQNEDSTASAENGDLPLPKKGLHKRMRSRDVPLGDDIQGFDKLDDLASPVQEESDVEAEHSPGGPGILVTAPSKAPSTTPHSAHVVEPVEATDAPSTSEDVPASTVTDASGPEPSTTEPNPSSIPASSGFANTSTASPFGVLRSAKSPETTDSASSPNKATTTSAFASSGLSAFASSEKSPFGTAAKSSGGFGGGNGSAFGGGSSTGFGNSISGLGDTRGTSPFATKPGSGFGSGGGFGGGGLGSGFGGAGKPFGSGTSSFAAPAGSTGTFGTAKPFTSSAEKDDDDHGSEQGDDGEEKHRIEEDLLPDPRFKEQDRKSFSLLRFPSCMNANIDLVETGEEGERTVFTCRAKLYHFDKEWKERGVGAFKINMRWARKSVGKEDEDADQSLSDEDVEAGESGEFANMERRARLLMRTDGVHRVVLNTPVFKKMKVGDGEGQEPSGKTMLLTGMEDGKPALFQIKVSWIISQPLTNVLCSSTSLC